MSVKRYMLQGSDNKHRHVTLCILKRITLHLRVDRSDLSNRLADSRKRVNLSTTPKRTSQPGFLLMHNYTSMRAHFLIKCAFHYTLAGHCVVKLLSYFPIQRKARNKLRNAFEGRIYHG